jgi:hypothetical protein
MIVASGGHKMSAKYGLLGLSLHVGAFVARGRPWLPHFISAPPPEVASTPRGSR